MVCLSNLRSVEAEEGRGVGVIVVVGGAGVKKKDCPMISASASSSSCVRVAIVLSVTSARAVFVVSAVAVVRNAAPSAVLVRGRRGRCRAAHSGRKPSRRWVGFGFLLINIVIVVIIIIIVIIVIVVLLALSGESSHILLSIPIHLLSLFNII